jgi:hypothetical protein
MEASSPMEAKTCLTISTGNPGSELSLTDSSVTIRKDSAVADPLSAQIISIVVPTSRLKLVTRAMTCMPRRAHMPTMPSEPCYKTLLDANAESKVLVTLTVQHPLIGEVRPQTAAPLYRGDGWFPCKGDPKGGSQQGPH